MRLGIETRHNLHEIPNVDEMAVMLSAADPNVVGYWHDTGHAATHEQLGFTTHEEWLRRHGHRMLGVHLHDITDERDHQCPGSGRLDWALVTRYVPESAIRVCEIGEWNGPECLKACPAFLVNVGFRRPTEPVAKAGSAASEQSVFRSQSLHPRRQALSSTRVAQKPSGNDTRCCAITCVCALAPPTDIPSVPVTDTSSPPSSGKSTPIM